MPITAVATGTRTAHDRVLHGWYMYDWANSAFAVTILSALFGPYLAKVVVPAGGGGLFVAHPCGFGAFIDHA